MQAVARLLPVLDRPGHQRALEHCCLDPLIGESTPAAALPAGGQAIVQRQSLLPVAEADGLAELQPSHPPAQQRRLRLVADGAVLTGGSRSAQRGAQGRPPLPAAPADPPAHPAGQPLAEPVAPAEAIRPHPLAGGPAIAPAAPPTERERGDPRPQRSRQDRRRDRLLRRLEAEGLLRVVDPCDWFCPGRAAPAARRTAPCSTTMSTRTPRSRRSSWRRRGSEHCCWRRVRALRRTAARQVAETRWPGSRGTGRGTPPAPRHNNAPQRC